MDQIFCDNGWHFIFCVTLDYIHSRFLNKNYWLIFYSYHKWVILCQICWEIMYNNISFSLIWCAWYFEIFFFFLFFNNMFGRRALFVYTNRFFLKEKVVDSIIMQLKHVLGLIASQIDYICIELSRIIWNAYPRFQHQMKYCLNACWRLSKLSCLPYINTPLVL